MEISFSRNMDGDVLVLVDGEVECLAKDCDGYDDLEKLMYLKRLKRVVNMSALKPSEDDATALFDALDRPAQVNDKLLKAATRYKERKGE